MKKLLINATIIYVSIFLLLLTSCNSHSDYTTTLGPEQLNLLTHPKAESTVVFDENGTRTTTTVSKAYVETQLTQENINIFLGGGTSYHNESGTAFYNNISTNIPKISVYAHSEDPYRRDSYPYQQEIDVSNESSTSYYMIHFNKKLSSKVINGITYTNVVLGIDPNRSDTLFWKKDIGILGWKRADVSWTAYRVF